ncbi:SIR2 family protein [Pseudoalteromonas sp. 2CM39R]|uniref:SIR2 family protein n=1 Tax=Pseudoalteromonas sp. 2CM39R TaxID=2929856 RepID=UPI0020C0D16B|nr:SIR2 family protein [Pseudoalteromonas sp. 2CM39R]MCK8126303.1 SIR2 family protein [Pseudoalteromonas sp. 2CM39R]
MDYLIPQFHDYLNEEGEIDVVGYVFSRENILKELEKEGYQEAFNDWLQQRQMENIARADEILALFDNLGRFRKLKEIYSRGAIIPFIGAGMSMPSDYPGWTKFLYQVLDETTVSKAVFDEAITQGQYEEAAQMLSDALPAGCFLEHVENAFGANQEIFGVVQRLPQIFKQAVVTTNFDNVLTRCYENANSNFEEELLGPAAEELPRALGENRRVLVKLHGKASSSRNRILTKDEYDKHYQDDQALESVIEATSNRTLLFLGCSLTVDRTIKCLKRIIDKKGPENVPRHYAFLKLNEGEDRIARKNQLGEANIFPIWYTDDHDESIEALLEKLTEGVHQ